MANTVLTDTGAANAVSPRKTVRYDTAGGSTIEEYVMQAADKATFYAGNLAPYTLTNAPFAKPASAVEEVIEDGEARVTIYRDYGYSGSGSAVDPATQDLSVQVEIISQERRENLSQIPYFASNKISSFPDVSGATDAAKLKNIRLRVLNILLNTPRGQRPSPNDVYIPDFLPTLDGASPSWDKWLELAGDLESVNLDAVTDGRYLAGAETWTLGIPVSWLLGGTDNGTPSALLNTGSAWPEFAIYQFAFENGIEDIFKFEYVLRKNTVRSTAYASQQSLVNVGKAFTHANIFTEIGVASGALKFAFSSDFTGGYWIKQAPQIRWEGGGNFSIRQDYIFTSVINSNFYALA